MTTFRLVEVSSSHPPLPPPPLSEQPTWFPTCDIDFHQARPRADGIGGLTDVGASHAVGDGALEIDGVVLDFHTPWQSPVWPGRKKRSC